MDISEIKQSLPLAQVLTHYGLKPDKHARLHCPFHADKTPSLQVYYKTQTCFCFSSNCKTHGKALDVIDFVMHREGVSKGEAIRYCRELIGGAPAAAPLTAQPREAILSRMFTYFKNAVHNSKPAQDYIRSRGLDATQIEVGYNSGQFHHGRRKDDELLAACESAGLLMAWGTNTREGGQAYKVFGRGCVVFALRGKAGEIKGLYFRSIINDSDQRHFYLKDRAGLYPCCPPVDTRRLILTESVIDAAVLLQTESIRRDYSVLACYGTNGFTPEHREAVASLGSLTEIIFAFDGDAAGKAATEKYALQLRDQVPGVALSVIALPDGEDLASLAAGHDPAVLEHLIAERTSFFTSTENTTATAAATEIPTAYAPPIPLPVPSHPAAGVLDSRDDMRLRYTAATAVYTVQGGIPKTGDSLKVTLAIAHKGSGLKRRHKVDLYEDKQVERLAREVGVALELDAVVMADELRSLADALDAYRDEQVKAAAPQVASYPLTAAERSAALSFLQAPDLLKRLNDLLGNTGIIGEENPRLFLLLIALSHKMAQPLHALIQGSSGSGKTRLLRQISDCMPPESVTRLTRVSDKVLYNYPETYFVNRLLCLEDIDGLSEEAEFALRELQSNGELNSATSIKLDDGRITSGQKTVRGPIGSLACTTRGEIYEDNMSRVFLVAVDESAAQTGKILAYQNRVAAGAASQGEEERAKAQVRNLVRALEPLGVVNPFAGKLRLPEQAHKLRRLNDLFLSFVKMVALVHQHQRERDREGRVIAEVSDLAAAVDIMFDSIVLKVDELDGSLRQFYEQLKSFVGETHRDREFTRFDIRDSLRMGKSQQCLYLSRLVELGYLQQYGHINRGFRYRIAHWDAYALLREQLKTDLQSQLAALACGQRPEVAGRQTGRQDVSLERETA
ncbi:CHC2 zinc finger domain-containing protein [Chitinophaga rhizosphaerae]|uniref:CHC2 zinc finger domain-containing protein n=1 Tax=Chitinophaga rhizosphaerae TaxID=1864947 RepID=UPI000F80FD9E|nr:CHC2 zinc finger domain-containing protein [Chitinophaga rhizosphaerae]